MFLWQICHLQLREDKMNPKSMEQIMLNVYIEKSLFREEQELPGKRYPFAS